MANERYVKMTDDFADSSMVYLSSPDGWGWDNPPRDPNKWDGDSTLLVRSKTSEQYLIYKIPDLGYFDMITYIGDRYYFPEKIKFYISPDGNNYTEVLANNVSKSVTENYGRYIFRPRMLFPKGTNYLKIVVEPGINRTGGLWLSSLSFYYNYQYSGYHSLTDPCQDYLQIESKSDGWIVDNETMSVTSELTTGRFHKADNTSEFLIYKYEDLANFKVTTYWQPDNYVPGTFAFYSSADNVTYTRILTGIKLDTQTAAKWNKAIYYPRGDIPVGTKYIKIESKSIPAGASFLPQISEISFSNGDYYICEGDYGLYDISPNNPGTAIELIDEISLPVAFELAQNFPNPFNPQTEISFKLANKADVQLEIFNILGQKISTLVNDRMAAGAHSVVWKGTNSNGDLANSGVYFYRITVKSGQSVSSASRKMILMK